MCNLPLTMQVVAYSPKDKASLPTKPGVYRFYDKSGNLLYVGKAKNLRKRVSSYFNGSSAQHSLKTRRMLQEIVSIELTVVASEYEALLLENNLIKSGQPPYNILLKDGKMYPYLCITAERFPRIIALHAPLGTSIGECFGPFTNSRAMYRLLALIKQLYTFRTCAYNLSERNVERRKFRVCLEYHLGNCKGPCAGLQSEVAYVQDVDKVRDLLKGSFQTVKKDLRDKMQQASTALAYEAAQQYKAKLQALEAYQAKSIITTPDAKHLDVFGLVSNDTHVFVNYLQVRSGAVCFAQTATFEKSLTEAESQLFPLLLIDFRQKYNSRAKEVVANIVSTVAMQAFTVTVPKIGDKRKLVLLAVKNALLAKQKHQAACATHDPDKGALSELQRDLNLPALPQHIECFDNSNLQGSYPVAAMVCFKRGKPFKAGYRRFRIKTVVGIDDVASMHEVLFRRYRKVVELAEPLPDLIVVDGGKGQLGAAVEALKKVGVYDRVAVVSLAKRMEEIYIPCHPDPLCLSKRSDSLKLLQQVRNEAHRFAVQFHKLRRSASHTQTLLTQVPGVGPKTAARLLAYFGSAKRVWQADTESLSKQVGVKKAQEIHSFAAQHPHLSAPQTHP